jgi:hypothetical protein
MFITSLIIIIILYLIYNYIIKQLYLKYNPKHRIYKVIILSNGVEKILYIKNSKGAKYLNDNINRLISNKHNSEFFIKDIIQVYEDVI